MDDRTEQESILVIGRAYVKPSVAGVGGSPIYRGKRDSDDTMADAAVTAKNIAVQTLKENFDRTVAGLSEVFEAIVERPIGALILDSIEVNLEVTADGKVGWLGSGIGLSGTTGVKLAFTRPNHEQAGSEATAKWRSLHEQ